MKKTLIALAALSAIAGAAQAQSTVTLYGLVDADFGAFTTNVVTAPGVIKSLSQTKINPEGLNGNRWGLKGAEDLGGGLSAIFNLESGFTIDDGASAQGGLLFGRRASVGLTGGFGKVELGRSSSAYNDVAYDHAMMGGASKFDPSNANNSLSAAAITGAGNAVRAFVATPNAANAALLATAAQPLMARTNAWFGFQERVNNSIKYTTPTFSGVTASVMYGLGEDKSATTDASKTVSASIKYVNGPLLVSAGYQSEGASTTAAVAAAPAAVPTLDNTLISIAYDFGVAKVGLGVSRAQYKNVFALATPASPDMAAQNEYDLSVSVPIGAVTLSADYAVSNGDDLGKSSGFGVQALYALSKRTTLYVGAVSTSTYDNLATVANALGGDIQRNTTYAAGVRHTF